MRLPRVMCMEQAEGTAVFPAGQLSCLLRPPGSPSGQILRPVDGRTALPILPGLTSPARKSCARQATAESETTCAALVASAFCPAWYASVPPGPTGSPTHQRTAPGRRQRKAGADLRCSCDECILPRLVRFCTARSDRKPHPPANSARQTAAKSGNWPALLSSAAGILPFPPGPSVLGRKSASCPKNSKRRTGQSLSVFLYPLLSV